MSPPLLAASVLLLSACTRVPFNVPPPPPVPDPVLAPQPPELQSEATDFEPEVTAETVGRDRLRLKNEVLGMAPIADSDQVQDLHEELILALLAGGFRRVLDLEAARSVEASHTRGGRGETVELSGQMADLMTLAPVSRARLLITGEIVHSGKQERFLPVHFWYADEDLAAYQGKLEDYRLARDARLAEVEAARSSYVEAFRQAEAEYDESRPWWQRLVDGVVEPKEAKARDAWLEELHRVESTMRRDPADGERLAREAAEREETRTVGIYVARLRLQIQQPDTGEVVAIMHLGAEGRTTRELVDNLAGIAQATLGDR